MLLRHSKSFSLWHVDLGEDSERPCFLRGRRVGGLFAAKSRHGGYVSEGSSVFSENLTRLATTGGKSQALGSRSDRLAVGCERAMGAQSGRDGVKG
jgi:hypothetical protein